MADGTIFTTGRFRVREFTRDDREPFIACHLDPVFSRHHLEHERGRAHASAVFDAFLAWQADHPRANFQFAIAPRDDPAGYIGNVGLRTDGLRPGEGELGIEVSPAWWRRGAASEVMRSLVPWARETLRIRTFTAETMPGNRAATRLAEKVGLVPTGQTGKRRWSF
ncbi:GNAT family N-acetyltransferase [Roseovarius sp.]|uniref:GNAT family N-acetyltransferase n=1 Tax=Roseovarius sp. TaxID=1486281 RepID=UPI002622974F|nr:GNAT family N-acetyltransferase [Roseovarius sp.]MDM8168229.1 GNAT family N-acetyltransferase [Roseovarius sp.]